MAYGFLAVITNQLRASLSYNRSRSQRFWTPRPESYNSFSRVHCHTGTPEVLFTQSSLSVLGKEYLSLPVMLVFCWWYCALPIVLVGCIDVYRSGESGGHCLCPYIRSLYYHSGESGGSAALLRTSARYSILLFGMTHISLLEITKQ